MEREGCAISLFPKDVDLITPDEAASILGIGMNKMYQLLKEKKVKSLRIGTHWKIPRQALTEYVSAESQYKKNIW